MGDRTARAGGIVALALWGTLLWVAPAFAADVPVTWPTFFRLGPGRQYGVAEELARGAVLDVLSCGDRWCQAVRGRTLGYVDRAALEPPPWQAAAQPGAAAPCFGSRRAGYGEGEQFRYCPR